jgi:hypothetical protein
MTYTVKHTTKYPGGHAQDPGYRTTTVVNAKGDREYNFHSDPDGSHVRYVSTRRTVRPATSTGSFRNLAAKHDVKMRPDLEAAIKAYLLREPILA